MGETFRRQVFDPRRQGVAHLLSESAHGERHPLTFDQPVVEPGRARRRHLPLKVEVSPVGENKGWTGIAATERWTAILTIVFDTPHDAERLRKNPLGVFVHAVNWSKELGRGTLCRLLLPPGKAFGNGAILESRAFALGSDLEADALM